MRVELRTETADQTRAVGEAFAELLRPRDAVILTGELGAGKTTLVQGIARGLDVTDHLASPTFTLVREYHGRLEVARVDVYRLERIQDVVDLGLEDLGDGEAVLLVEWGDAVEEVLPADHVTIELTGGSDDEGRRVVVHRRTDWNVAGNVRRAPPRGASHYRPRHRYVHAADERPSGATDIPASVPSRSIPSESVMPAPQQLLAGPLELDGSAASRSASVPGCSPGCASAWRRPRPSPRCWAFRSSASRAWMPSRTRSGSRRGGSRR
jgi:tRNA threonylcarbamoyladenosine biosynthesis protein TsaE